MEHTRPGFWAPCCNHTPPAAHPADWPKIITVCVWLRKQLKGTAWLSAVSKVVATTRGARRVLQVGASWAGRGAKIEV